VCVCSVSLADAICYMLYCYMTSTILLSLSYYALSHDLFIHVTLFYNRPTKCR